MEYIPLQRAILRGNWFTVEWFLARDPGVVINNKNMTPLHFAVGTENSVHLVLKMVEFMSNDAISQRTNDTGETALHIAASVGNFDAARILVKRMPQLLYVPTSSQNIIIFPIQAAAMYAQRRMTRYLYSITTERIAYEGIAGLTLLIYLIKAKFFDIALDLVDRCPDLAQRRWTDGTSALAVLAENMTASGYRVGFWKRFIPIRYSENQEQIILATIFCDEMGHMSYEEAEEISRTAAIVGNSYIAQMVMEANPNVLFSSTGQNKSLFHLAVENRSEGVFNYLLYKVGAFKHRYVSLVDIDGNTMLHAAAKLGPRHKLNQISGAALQMQRELQWYKEVKEFVLPEYMNCINNKRKTPPTIFTEEHKQLKEEGEKWMKDTSESCSIAAALIVTIMFAAAITVPGDYDDATGFPKFSKDREFIVFGIANAISLFASTTSLLMFLSIFTSRFAEEDFLYALPKRLIIGLGMLFLSVLFMMIAFIVTVYLVVGQKNPWIFGPLVALACLPVSSFVLLQYPLLADLISSTYGPGIFRKQNPSFLL